MDSVTRNCFLQQISLWAQDYISKGRSPFRKTEISPTIITSSGVQSPDLVLWINQDSFVAGGVVLFPDDETFDMAAAQACSQALGIRYFATWTAQNISVWSVDDQSIHSQIQPPKTTDNDRIDRFEDSLIQLMDEFRTLAVLGLCPPEQLSFWHLTNLCIGAHNRALPLLSEHFRRNPELHAKHLPSFEVQAQEKLSMSMARLLTLLYFEKIPYNLPPEDLDHALGYLSSELAVQSLSDLKPVRNEPTLDENSAVLFHHLLRRLDQVSIFNNSHRAIHVLNQLLQHSSLCLDTDNDAEAKDYNMLLFCNTVPCNTEQLIEVDQPARLALKHLLRRLMDCPTGQHHYTELFQLQPLQHADDPQQLPLKIKACLSNVTTPATQQRNSFLTHLRLVWPNHTFEFRRSTPTWVYHFCYILGIMKADSQLCIQLPSSMLSSPFSDIIIELLQQHFTLHEISQRTPQVVHLSLSKGSNNSVDTRFNGEVLRSMAWSKLRQLEPEQLVLTLFLPEVPYRLLQQNLVRFDSKPTQHNETGVEQFKNSSLGQCYNHHLQPKVDRAKRSKWTPRIPLPSDAILTALENLAIDNDPAHLTRIDAELERLLDIEIASVNHSPTVAEIKVSHREAKEDKKTLANKIIQLIQVKGVPEFPTHYLYEFYLPQLSHYSRHDSPWEISSEFMGTYQLSNQRGDTEITATNEFTAHAIILTSYGKAEINLPDDRTICSTIVTRYLTDLDEIHTIIWRECHAALHQSDTANRLVRKLWKELGLPPWNTIDKYLKRFNIND
jgi:hypothetical protein